MKLEYFYYMVEIAKAGSISRAADNLDVSQPYLSLELKNLEKKMGISLLTRGSKGVSLTESGEKLLDYSNEIIELVAQVKSLHKNSSTVKSKLSISSIYSFTFLDLYHNFSVMHDREEDNVRYEEIPNEGIPEKIKNGSNDIGIMYVDCENSEGATAKIEKEFLQQGMNFVPLVREPLSVVVNRNHPIARYKSVEMSQLKGYKLVLDKQKILNKNSSLKNNTLSFIASNCTLQPILCDNNRSLLYYLTKNETCFTVGQKSLNITSPFVTNGNLVYIPIEGLQNCFITGYIINADASSFPLQEKFIHYVEDYFQDYNKRI